MATIQCSACGKTFRGDRFGESHAFDAHDCPATPKVEPGESWADYQERAKAFAKAWREKNPQPSQGR